MSLVVRERLVLPCVCSLDSQLWCWMEQEEWNGIQENETPTPDSFSSFSIWIIITRNQIRLWSDSKVINSVWSKRVKILSLKRAYFHIAKNPLQWFPTAILLKLIVLENSYTGFVHDSVGFYYAENSILDKGS